MISSPKYALQHINSTTLSKWMNDEDYTDECTVSYRGRAMAIVRSGYEKGPVTVEVSADGMASVKVELVVI